MRLIDADRFKENILSGLYVFCQENKEDIANAIDDEPTVDYTEELIELKELRDTMEMIKKHYILIDKGVRDNPNDLMIGSVMEANNEDHD